MLFEPKEIKKHAAASALTPKIKLLYADFKVIDDITPKSAGYFEFQAKSSKTSEIHCIRALNLESELAGQSPSKAITLFLQETLRFCLVNPSSILLDTFEFHDNKICYAIKPLCISIMTRTQKSTAPPRLDIPRLLKQVLLDIEQISSTQPAKFHIFPSNIYQIENSNPPVYFLHDWTQIICTKKDEVQKNPLDTTQSHSIGEEKEHIYNLALQILELYGVKGQEIQSIKEVSPSFYDSIIGVAVRNNVNLEPYFDPKIKMVMIKMLERDVTNRPSIEQIVQEVSKIEMDNSIGEELKSENPGVSVAKQIKLTIEESIQKIQKTKDDEIKGLEIISQKDNDIKTYCHKPTERAWNRQSGGLSQIIPNDNRVRYTKTDEFPYSVHGIVVANSDEGDHSYGTGVMIAPDVVLTAAYNLYNYAGSVRNKRKDIKFTPGINGKESPFGIIEAFEVYAPEDFIDNRSSKEYEFGSEEFGIIILKEPIGLKTGYFGLHIAEKDTLKNKEIAIIGYPSDKRWKKSEDVYEQWGEKGRILAFESGNSLLHQITTSPGQGGSAIFYQEAVDEYYVIGIHLTNSEEYKTGVWMTKERLDQIQEWVKLSRNRKKFGDQELVSVDQELITLDLSKKLIGEVGINMLLKSDITQLEALNLESSQLTPKAATDLSAEKIWPQLKLLNLASNSIGDLGVSQLSMNSSWNNLTTLNLSSNGITGKGAASLAANKTWKSLKLLDLGYNLIGEEGASELGKNVTWINLESLVLQFNLLGRGAKGLSENKHWKNLKNLNLLGNSIHAQNIDCLMNHPHWKNPLNIII